MDQQLKKVFMEALDLTDSEYSEHLKLGDNPKWDSVGHLGLIFTLESEFDVKFDMERIPELLSVSMIKEEIKKLK